VKWLADENFDNDIIRGILRRAPEFDIVRVQDVPPISGEDDPVMLAWATTNERVLLTHDLSTMIPAMREQLRRASLCTSIVLVPDSLPIGQVIEEILLLDACAC
jgi:predicted nuclease of predicted toxin-antitoxin system